MITGEVLPSFNIAFEFGETQMLRFGIARVMNRAPLDDMRSSESIFISGFGANGNAGNPQLDPTVADQYSLSYEIYPDIATSIVFALFYNDLETFIGTEFVTRPVIDVGGNIVDVVFQTPGNGDGGYIRGGEVTVNSTFGFISPGLDPLGIAFNYAYTDSNVLPVAPGGVGVSLTGLSKDVANLALYWASHNFEARVGLGLSQRICRTQRIRQLPARRRTRLLTSFRISYDFNEDFRVGIFGRQHRG